MKKSKNILMVILFVLITEIGINLDRIITYILPEKTAVMEPGKGMYINEEGYFVTIPDVKHELYVNNILSTPYSVMFNGSIEKSLWDLEFIPFNMYCSINKIDYDWSNYFEVHNNLEMLNFPSLKCDYIKFEFLLPDYTEFTFALVADDNIELDINFARMLVEMLIAILMLRIFRVFKMD